LDFMKKKNEKEIFIIIFYVNLDIIRSLEEFQRKYIFFLKNDNDCLGFKIWIFKKKCISPDLYNESVSNDL